MEKVEKNFIKDIITTPFNFSISIYYSKNGVVKIDFLNEKEEKISEHKFKDITYMLIKYFKGKRVNFENIPIFLNNFSEFGLKVLNACRKIPYGSILTYKELANKVGNKNAYRAVGNILGKNPIPIIIPCHRVIGSDGKLHGFTSGIEIKKTLLELERFI